MAAGTTLVAAIAVVPASAVARPAPSTGSSTAPVADYPDSGLRAALAAIADAGVPGALAAVRDGERDWRDGAGLAQVSPSRPMRPYLRHRVGSITKTFVAATLLQLVEEGRVGLDDPVGRWLPETVPGEVGAQVSVRMLLNHTSGIGNYTDALLDSHAGIERVRTTTFSPAELAAVGLALPATGVPGAAFSYSNTNYVLVGLLIEAVTGEDAAVEVQRRILRPLRLRDTYFPGADPDIRGPHGGAYFAPYGVRDLSEFNMTWAYTAGEIVSTMADLNTFFRALLGGELLTAAMLDEMLTTVPMVPGVPAAGGYGLGIYSLPTGCGEFWGHDGGVLGHLTVSLHSRDGDRQVSFGLNLSHYQIGAPDAHPADAAWQTFMLTALCPNADMSARSAETLPQLPGATRTPGSPAVVAVP
ncbi:serine hydrolase domain-containing protein [Solwaraspora sp. WMMB335]|uniref:serine hydrolase domain-containing protein n=1 Tax=Solwaraspora sp. WMMB335 TaxID=3404118 RepID=UPI003B92E07D